MRRLERIDSGGAANAIAVVVTVPAAEKFEIVGLGFGSAGAHAHTILMAYGVGGTVTQFFDQINMVAGQFSAHANYDAVVVNAGEDLLLFPIDFSGSEAIACNVHFVRVSPV